MLLVSKNRPGQIDIRGIRFAMLDGDRTVVCFALEGALEDLDQPNEAVPIARRMQVFEEHRSVIERIASDLYDAGERSPKVGSANIKGRI